MRYAECGAAQRVLICVVSQFEILRSWRVDPERVRIEPSPAHESLDTRPSRRTRDERVQTEALPYSEQKLP
jgi:hypothetical protein